MTGTWINVAAVLAGSGLGVLLGGRLSEGLQRTVLNGVGLVTLLLGVDLALAWGREGATPNSPLLVLGGLLIGGVIGELIGIERRLEGLGDAIQRRFARDGASTVSEGFVSASLLFCVGSLAVVGSIQEGLSGEYQTLATKATIDGFAAVALAASLGWGVGLSAVTILVYQGAITLGAGALDEVLRGEPLAVLTSVGGIAIVAIALKLLRIADLRVGNFLPALVVAPALALLV